MTLSFVEGFGTDLTWRLEGSQHVHVVSGVGPGNFTKDVAPIDEPWQGMYGETVGESDRCS